MLIVPESQAWTASLMLLVLVVTSDVADESVEDEGEEAGNDEESNAINDANVEDGNTTEDILVNPPDKLHHLEGDRVLGRSKVQDNIGLETCSSNPILSWYQWAAIIMSSRNYLNIPKMKTYGPQKRRG